MIDWSPVYFCFQLTTHEKSTACWDLGTSSPQAPNECELWLLMHLSWHCWDVISENWRWRSISLVWAERFSINRDKTSIDCTSEDVHFRPTWQHSAQDVGAQLLLFDIKISTIFIYKPWGSYNRPSVRLPSAITSLWLRRLQRPYICHWISPRSENISIYASLLPSWHLLF